MVWWFSNKKRVDEIKEETKKSFDSVKKDINSITSWINHLHSEKNLHKKEIEEIKDILSTIKIDLDGLKNIVSVMGEVKNKNVFKTPLNTKNKQAPVYVVQTGVQTPVQTPNLDNFSIIERAILWVLLNTDMKLSYDDIATMLKKEKSTIRGQINTIKRKSEGLIEEQVEKTGRKRIFIPDVLKEKILKKTKVRVKNNKNR